MVQINASAIMESVERNVSRPYAVSIVKYGERVFNIEESRFYEDKEHAMEAAKKIKPAQRSPDTSPPNTRRPTRVPIDAAQSAS